MRPIRHDVAQRFKGRGERPCGTTAPCLLARHRYLALGTAGGDGRPRATPVFYAADGEHRILWVTAPDSPHSGNIAAPTPYGRMPYSVRELDTLRPLGRSASAIVARVGGGADREHGGAPNGAEPRSTALACYSLPGVQRSPSAGSGSGAVAEQVGVSEVSGLSPLGPASIPHGSVAHRRIMSPPPAVVAVGGSGVRRI